MLKWLRPNPAPEPTVVSAKPEPTVVAAEKRPVLIQRLEASLAKLERRGDEKARDKAERLRRELAALRLEQMASDVRAGVVVAPGPASLSAKGE